jgi:hypothetical protein
MWCVMAMMTVSVREKRPVRFIAKGESQDKFGAG